MDALEKTIQIALLKGAVKHLRHDNYTYGCCSAIIDTAIELELEADIRCSTLEMLIPSFNRENSIKLAKQKKFKTPNIWKNFWWESGIYRNVRITFLNALIAELKTEM